MARVSLVTLDLSVVQIGILCGRAEGGATIGIIQYL